MAPSLSEKSTKNVNNLIATVLLIYYMLYRMPIVSHYVSTYLTMILLCGLVVIFLMKRGKKKILISPYSIWLLPAYAMFLIDLSFAKSFDILYSAWSFFLFVLPIFLGKVIISEKYENYKNIVTVSIIWVYFITAVTTIAGLSIFPDASRLLATGGEYHKTFSPYNIGGYNFIYSLVILHPLIVAILRKRFNVLLAMVFSSVLAFCVIKSAYTIALLVFAISLISYLLPVDNDKKLKKGRLLLFISVLIILAILAIPILNALSEWDAIDDKVAQKIEDVINILNGDEVEGIGAEQRQIRYQMSFKAIIQNPIFGSRLGEKIEEGGHSFILDTIAKWGAVGMFFMIVFFVQFIKMYKKITTKSVSRYFAILFLVLVVILSALNPTFWEFELGLIAPLMLSVLSKDKGVVKIKK